MKHTTRTVIGTLGVGALLAAGVGVGVWKLDPAWSSSNPEATAGVSAPTSKSKAAPSSSTAPVTPSTASLQSDTAPAIERPAKVLNQHDPLLPPNAYIPDTPTAPSTTTTPTPPETTTPSTPVVESEIPLIPPPPEVELSLTEDPSEPPQSILDSWNSWAETMGLAG